MIEKIAARWPFHVGFCALDENREPVSIAQFYEMMRMMAG